MNALREIFVDLVDKRLWPVAALLVGALVVIPLALSKSPSSTDTRAAVAPAAGTLERPGQSVRLGSEPSVSVRGTQRDPFKQQHLPKAPSLNGLGAAVAAAAAGASGSTPSLTTNTSKLSSSGSTGGTASGTTPSSGSSSGSSSLDSQVEVKFGQATGRLKTYKLTALNALPGNSTPILIFTGMQKDGKTAVFLVSSDATSQGDGKCSPSRTVCSSLLMKEGDTEFLDVVGSNGSTVQYELDMDKVLKK